MSNDFNGSDCPAAWKDIFIINIPRVRTFFVPCQSVALVESKTGQWIIRTMFGDFKTVEDDAPVLDLIRSGQREFNMLPTTLTNELLL
ncbi:MAG: hypothetical protein K6L81_17590 [Agarilytica sp.]